MPGLAVPLSTNSWAALLFTLFMDKADRVAIPKKVAKKSEINDVRQNSSNSTGMLFQIDVFP